MKKALSILFIAIFTFLSACARSYSKDVNIENIQGIWIGAYFQRSVDTAFDGLFKNPSPLALLLDISADTITFKSFEVYDEYEISFVFSLQGSFLITLQGSIIDSLHIIKTSKDSLVIRRTNWDDSYMVFKKLLPNKTTIPDLSSKMFQIHIMGMIDTLEITNDSAIFPSNIFSYTSYDWKNYKGIIYLQFYGSSSIPFFLNSVQNGTIYLKSFYNAKDFVLLKEIVNYKKGNINYLYGSWAETKTTVNGANIPPPPLPPHLKYEDSFIKLYISEDSLSFVHMGYSINRYWKPNMTNKYIHVTKPLNGESIWKIIKLSVDSLIIEMGDGNTNQPVTFIKSNP